MIRHLKNFSFFFCLLNLGLKYANAQSSDQKQRNPTIEAGVSKGLAIHRKSMISHIQYALNFDIPLDQKQPIAAKETLTFNLKSKLIPLQIDFKEDPKNIKSLMVNGRSIAVNFNKEHLIVDIEYLKSGNNEIKFNFIAGEGALNRNADYLYTLFVPDRARTAFPCFDQPDLKAVYTLTLVIPVAWKAIANAALKDTVVNGARKTYHFATSDVLSTYLFAFTAGKFFSASPNSSSINAAFLYRETDTAKIRKSIPEIYKIHKDALKYYENWTSIPYPFQKFGFAAIPDFQFGGMEHPGNIQYKASTLFLDKGTTKDQRNARSNLIAHETAHMWFGDLVTMNWFTDVWMKEVFANFMADKSMEDSIGKNEYDLKFLVDHVPAAYGVDRTKGSNPIRQDLENLKDAGSLYGNIIYHKAPVMMRQLERLMGKEKFKLGVQQYLKEFALGNASWPDLIRILSTYTNADLQSWNKVWVNETGRPVISYDMEVKDKVIRKFVITQKSEYGEQRIWPQLFELTLYYPNYRQQITVNMNAAEVKMDIATGMQKPLFVLFNSSGQGYGLWPVDTAMLSQIYKIEKPLSRASAYISLYENMLSRRSVTPQILYQLFLNGLNKEGEELNLKLITSYLSTIYWNFTAPAERENMSLNLENALWNAMERNSVANQKKILFKAYQDLFLTTKAYDRLYKIWKDQRAPQGVELAEDDYTALAFSLSLRPIADTSILSKQLSRITNPDRKKRFEFIMPALSATEAIRDDFFKSLQLKGNRSKESNVVTALNYLHHPLRQASSQRYLAKSLDMLSEIQSTGDIFFPQSWLHSTFGNYQSVSAGNIVRDFLNKHPNYNPKLKEKILQTADNLFRAERLLK